MLVILQHTKVGNYFVLNLNLYNCLLTEVLFICKFMDISEPILAFYHFNEMDAQEAFPGIMILEEDIM